MPIELLLYVVIALLLVCTVLLVVLLRGGNGGEDTKLLATRVDEVNKNQDRTAHALRDDLARSREAAVSDASRLRGEVASSMKGLGDTVFQHLGTLSNAQQEQLGNVLAALTQMTEAHQGSAGQLREEVGASLNPARCGGCWGP